MLCVGAALIMLLAVVAAFQLDKRAKTSKMSGVTDFVTAPHGAAKVTPI